MSQLSTLELFVEVFVKVTETQLGNSLDESFLLIREEDKAVRFVTEHMHSVCLKNILKMLKKLKPIHIIFGIDNHIGEREKGFICINSCSCEKNPYF